MAADEFMGFVAPTIGEAGSESIFDKSLREVLLRAALPTSPAKFRPGLAYPGVEIGYEPLPGMIPEAYRPDLDEADPFQTLERARSDVASMARFGHRVECASYYLYVAFDMANVEDFELSTGPDAVKPKRGIGRWYSDLANTTFQRWSNLRRALLHEWTPSAEAEALTSRAFTVLSEITPAQSQLRGLFVHDRPRAFLELAHQLDLYVDQLKSAILLASDLEIAASAHEDAEERLRINAVQAEVLSKAGKPLSLTEAAQQLNVTRQALHKRIGLGSALGLMRGAELVVPDAQFVTTDGKCRIVDGLADVVRLFDDSGAGRWSALQFLIEIDPNLRRPPLDALKAGEREAVAHAARAFLTLDEG